MVTLCRLLFPPSSFMNGVWIGGVMSVSAGVPWDVSCAPRGASHLFIFLTLLKCRKVIFHHFGYDCSSHYNWRLFWIVSFRVQLNFYCLGDNTWQLKTLSPVLTEEQFC